MWKLIPSKRPWTLFTMTKLEIDRTLVCSTSHLSGDDNTDLFEETTNLVVYEMGEYGWMIWTRSTEERKHSANLESLLEFARKHDCEWIRFDRDADIIEGLKTFEW